MALLQYRAPVDYEAQQEAFRDFLENFKSSESTSEESAADAIDGLRLDGDGTSDEYDFMDDAENGDRAQSRKDERTRDKRKYMSLLQDIADRVKSNILIELDDLNLVRGLWVVLRNLMLISHSRQYERSLGDEHNLKLVESITNNTKHYVDIFSEAVDKMMPKESREVSYVEGRNPSSRPRC